MKPIEYSMSHKVLFHVLPQRATKRDQKGKHDVQQMDRDIPQCMQRFDEGAKMQLDCRKNERQAAERGRNLALVYGAGKKGEADIGNAAFKRKVRVALWRSRAMSVNELAPFCKVMRAEKPPSPRTATS